MSTFTTAALSITGRRSANQDAYVSDAPLGLFAVADGMGGYEGGELASQLALEALSAFLRDIEVDPDRTCPTGWDVALSLTENLLAQGIIEAHEAVVRERHGLYEKMGTTVVAFLRTAEGLAVGHVGDSRAYRLRGGILSALTRDHSMVEQLRDLGMVGPEEDGPPGMSHIVTAALGIGGFQRPTLALDKPRAGDRYLLCSDGLCGVLSDAEIADHLSTPSLTGAAETLVQAALEAGSRDNITVVVVAVT